jgi:competence protein ComEC
MKKWSIIFILITVATLYAYSYAVFLTPSNILSVSFLDVGQGDAIYIRTPNGNDVLIDGGPDDSVIQKLHEVVPSFDRDIDLIIETHPDKDHIAGLIPVFEQYNVNNFLRSEVSSGTSFDIALQEHAQREFELKNILARRGERIILDKKYGVYLDILFPDQDTSNFKETNDASIVARLVYKSKSFLLTGDSPSSVEQFLARNDKQLIKSTVLKLGHHGSKTSSSEEFLDQVQPAYAIVSAGKNNSYHHPNQTVVDRVNSHQSKLLSTIDLGTITFETDGTDIWQK